MEKDARIKVLDDTMANIDKTYGKGTIMKLGDGVINPIESISTGSLILIMRLELEACLEEE